MTLNPQLMKPFFIFSLVILLLFAHCATTITRTKNPVFGTKVDNLQKDLNQIVSCENISVNGREISKNGKSNSDLEIDMINGRNIPSDDNQMMALGKSIASKLKSAVKDSSEYDTYTVLFVTSKQEAGVTRRTWKGKAFKTKEL